MKAPRVVAGLLALAVVAGGAAAQAQEVRRHRIGGDRGGRPGHHRAYGGHRQHGGWGVAVDGGVFLGLIGLGILLDAIEHAPPPAVWVEPPPPPRWRRGLRRPYRPADPEEFYRRGEPGEAYEPSERSEYPAPRRYYPECKEFLGNPGAMAFCEKGVLERENEERRRVEQRAYETGRAR